MQRCKKVPAIPFHSSFLSFTSLFAACLPSTSLPVSPFILSSPGKILPLNRMQKRRRRRSRRRRVKEKLAATAGAAEVKEWTRIQRKKNSNLSLSQPKPEEYTANLYRNEAWVRRTVHMHRKGNTSHTHTECERCANFFPSCQNVSSTFLPSSSFVAWESLCVWKRKEGERGFSCQSAVGAETSSQSVWLSVCEASAGNVWHRVFSM